ncbi:hypothetical protein JL720_38 [Aureococcus anophagefferens]|nr:hypothetical protein JL720_38 [Aureococcus anophagefferens]
MSVAYLRAAVNTVAIRDEPGSVDRIGDFGKGDAVRLVAPVGGALPEWVEVDMVGAVREPAEEGRERPATGFVRTRNRHARPLLKGGLEEYEQRQRVHLKARELVEARAAATSLPYDVAALKADLANAFGHAPWLEPYVAAEHMVHTLMMVAQVDIDKDARRASGQRTLRAAAPPPPSGAAAAAGVKPPASPVELRAPAAPAAPPAGPGDAPAAAPAAPRAPLASPALALAADGALLGELWARLPPPARGALAASCTALALAARRVPWKRRPARDGENPPLKFSSFGRVPLVRLSVQLADDHGVLCCDLDVDRDWRAYFRELWTTRRFKWGGSRGAGAFSVGAMVRFRPRAAGGAAGETAADVFLPLHQRLQLRRLGHETGLADEVSRRLGPVGEDVETYEARRGATPKNTELLRAAKGTPAAAPTTRTRSPTRRRRSTTRPRPRPPPRRRGRGARRRGARPRRRGSGAAAHAFAAAANVSARVVSTEPTRVLVGVPGSGLVYYDFERVLGGRDAARRRRRRGAARPGFCDGLNGCLLAYGQTGSGKTHTMFGPPGALATRRRRNRLGARRASCAACSRRARRDRGGQVRGAAVDARLSFSYLELYQERLTDLLGGGDVKLYSVGGLVPGQGAHVKLFLVDLGGSEQVKKSKAEGDRFREAVTINKSLVALGRVVDALVNKNKHHVPYYESKLTTLLQPAFGGNSKTVVLVSASPDDGDGDESLNSIAGARATLARLEAGGAKARALGEAGDARLRGMGAGHAAASRLQAMSHQDDTGGDVSKEAGLSTRQAHAHRGAYSHVDDDAGLYVAESDKLAALLQRKAAIVGAPAK